MLGLYSLSGTATLAPSESIHATFFICSCLYNFFPAILLQLDASFLVNLTTSAVLIFIYSNFGIEYLLLSNKCFNLKETV